MGSDTVFIEDVTPLTQVTSFKYIRLILMAAYNEWTAVVSNLRKARQEWERLTRVLGREEADSWTSGQIYLAVVQLVTI